MLRVEGEVRSPCELSFDGLAALPGQVEDVSKLAAARVGAAVRLQSILDAAGASREASRVTLESSDGRFVQTAPLVDVVRSGLVIYRLGDAPLPADQGGPVRFLIPNAEDCDVGGIDRCTNVKALGVIRVER